VVVGTGIVIGETKIVVVVTTVGVVVVTSVVVVVRPVAPSWLPLLVPRQESCILQHPSAAHHRDKSLHSHNQVASNRYVCQATNPIARSAMSARRSTTHRATSSACHKRHEPALPSSVLARHGGAGRLGVPTGCRCPVEALGGGNDGASVLVVRVLRLDLVLARPSRYVFVEDELGSSGSPVNIRYHFGSGGGLPMPCQCLLGSPLSTSQPGAVLGDRRRPVAATRDARGRSQTRSEVECWVNVGWVTATQPG